MDWSWCRGMNSLGDHYHWHLWPLEPTLHTKLFTQIGCWRRERHRFSRGYLRRLITQCYLKLASVLADCWGHMNQMASPRASLPAWAIRFISISLLRAAVTSWSSPRDGYLSLSLSDFGSCSLFILAHNSSSPLSC